MSTPESTRPAPAVSTARRFPRRGASRTIAPVHPSALLPASAAARLEAELRGRLGLMPVSNWLSRAEARRAWIIAGIMGALGAVARLVGLAHPHQLVFDETYYVKEATSILLQGYEGKWSDNANDLFVKGDFSGLSATEAERVVHPPLGKWLMAAGEWLFGPESSFGWRFTTAIAGIIIVMLTVFVAQRLFHNSLLAAFAGFAVALDGMGIVLSRTGILDNLVALFALLTFWAILKDRDWTRARLARRVAHGSLRADGSPATAWGPVIWWRPWLVLAGVFAGCTTGVKWSGIYLVAVMGILVFAWGVAARKAVGVRLWVDAGIAAEGVPAFVNLVVTWVVTYLLCWIPWFANSKEYGHGWTATQLAGAGAGIPIPGAPNWLNDFLHYHEETYQFHTGLSTPHTYQSQAWEWLFQIRPVSFYWEGTDEMAKQCAPGSQCVQAITSVGNVAIWWPAVVGLILVIWAAFAKRDWRAWSIIAGYVALWAPWLMYVDRTIFQFYAVAILPFVVLALTYGVGLLCRQLAPGRSTPQPFSTIARPVEDAPADGAAPGRLTWVEVHSDAEAPAPSDVAMPVPAATTIPAVPEADENGSMPPEPEQNAPREALLDFAAVDEWWNVDPKAGARLPIYVFAGVILVFTAFWYPIWTGQTVSYNFWHIHMWLKSWI